LVAGGSPRRSHGLRGSLKQRHFYEEADPDRALAMLEEEMSMDMEEALDPRSTRTDSSMRTFRGLARLRELLEKECDAQVGLYLSLITSSKPSSFLLLEGFLNVESVPKRSMHVSEGWPSSESSARHRRELASACAMDR